MNDNLHYPLSLLAASDAICLSIYSEALVAQALPAFPSTTKNGEEFGYVVLKHGSRLTIPSSYSLSVPVIHLKASSTRRWRCGQVKSMTVPDTLDAVMVRHLSFRLTFVRPSANL